MRALITNDDGIDAYGLSLLRDLVAPFCDEVITVAPSGNRSGTGQSITLHNDIQLQQVGTNHYACSGTPADCVLLAMNLIYKDNLPDIVFSGINHGMNAADDIGYSGTIGAAKEGAIWGIRSIAFSQRSGVDEAHFGPARKVGSAVIAHALSQSWKPRTVLNVNFPSMKAGEIKGIRVGQLDRHKLADSVLEAGDENTYRIGPMHMRQDTDLNSDRAYLDSGYVSMTPILLDSTDRHQLEQLTSLDL